MAHETRHIHLLSQCRHHQNDQEILPFGEGGGVFDTMEEVSEELDKFVEVQPEDGLVDFYDREIGLVLFHTINGDDERTKSFGGDGRCYKIIYPVWCIGDPDGCRAAIGGAAMMSTIDRMMGALMDRMGGATSGEFELDADDPLSKMLNDLMGDHRGPHVHDDGTAMADFGKRAPQFGSGLANEPIKYVEEDDLFGFDFGGFDEPTDKTRLN